MEHLVRRYRGLLLYAVVSVLSTVLDTAAAWFLFSTLGKSLLLANTVGVILGFLLHYLLASKSVFRAEYGLTSASPCISAPSSSGSGWRTSSSRPPIVWRGNFSSESVSFLLSKGLSVVLPFFVLYYLRLTLYRRLK